MNEIRLVLCSFPDAGQARQIGKALVERRLAACVNLIPAVESIYRWENEIESATEVLALFKTTAAAWPEFEKSLTELHPYDVPEIIAVSPDRVVAPYRDWVLANVDF